ncbi:MAG: hypothetical protein U1E26_10965 [Coriobacteriia bacterium]|nr:hypothetical protein [Coriobacteriia bacterium]
MSISVIAAVMAGVVAATAWGLSVSVVASAPRTIRGEIPGSHGRVARGSSHPVVSAPWGSGLGEVGLATDGESRGPMSFGVDDRERVWVLDQENGRLLCFDDGVVDLSVSLPPGEFEDVAVERDRICVLARNGSRRVVVFDGGGRELGQISIAQSVPPVLHVRIEGSDVVVECPMPDSRKNHTIATLAPLRAVAPEGTSVRSGVALRGGARASASLASSRDIAIDVTSGGLERARLRLRSELDVVSILDVSGDARGGLYVTSVLASDTTLPNTGVPLLSVAHYAPSGESLSWAMTPYEPLTDVLRRVVVTPTGRVYRMDSDENGLRIVRWNLSPSSERSSR